MSDGLGTKSRYSLPGSLAPETRSTLIDLRGTVPGRSPRKLFAWPGGGRREALTGCVLHALLTLFLIFTFLAMPHGVWDLVSDRD